METSNVTQDHLVLKPPDGDLPVLPAVQSFDTSTSSFVPMLLHFAVNNNNNDKVKQLISKGIDLNYVVYGHTPLILSIIKENYDITETLIRGGADVSALEKTKWRRQALHFAAQAGNLKIVQMLVERGASVQAADRMMFTPLHWATISRHVDVVRYLLDCQAHVSARDDRGRTALHYACEHEFFEIVAVLLDSGARIDQRDNFWWSPLHLSIACFHTEMVKYLIVRGADVELPDWNGNTPLLLLVDDLYLRTRRFLRDAIQICILGT